MSELGCSAAVNALPDQEIPHSPLFCWNNAQRIRNPRLAGVRQHDANPFAVLDGQLSHAFIHGDYNHVVRRRIQKLTQSFLGVHAKPFNGCPQKIGTAALNQGLQEEEGFTPRFPDNPERSAATGTDPFKPRREVLVHARPEERDVQRRIGGRAPIPNRCR